jgi:GATA-binding protein, other eukaryote
VCNKCGLYERTHLRPRPLRFDELRAGSKTRKQIKAAGSPKVGKLSPVKKESMDGSEQPQLQRRSSVSSSNGSTGNGASSDWDDAGKRLC